MSDVWPTAQHFQQMVQHPRLAFRDSRLQSLRFEIDPNTGLPRPWSGSFAVVFKGEDRNGGGNVAVRIFVKKSRARRERYQLISEHVQHGRPRAMVGFEYRDSEVLAPDGKRYPLVVMEWIEGDTIFKWAERACGSGDGGRIASLVSRWVAVVHELRERQLSHGDLQHGNILVSNDDSIWLVDYDGVAVPKMYGQPNWETGIPPYQHPSRNATTELAPHLDNFGGLLICLALRVLSLRPQWWGEFVVQRNADTLLFTKSDLEAPQESKLFGRLGELDDEMAALLLKAVLRAIMGPIETVPALSDVLSPPTSTTLPIVVEADTEANATFVDRSHQDKMPPDQSRGVGNPQNGREPPSLHGNEQHWPAGDTRVEQFVRAIRHGEEVVTRQLESEIVELARAAPDGPRQHLERVTLAMGRISAHDRFLSTLQQGSDIEIADAWQALSRMQIDHWADEVQAGRAILAARRVEICKVIEELHSEPPSAEFDERLVTAWDDEICAEWEDVQDWMPVLEAARSRRQVHAELENAIRSGNHNELAWHLAGNIWDDYQFPESWQPAVEAATRSLGEIEELIAAIEAADQQEFLARFNPVLLSRFRNWFEGHSEKLEKLIQTAIRSCEGNGLQLPVAHQSMVPMLENGQMQCLLRWQWPQPRFSSSCILLLCPNKPDDSQLPGDILAWDSWRIDRASWERNSSQHLIYVDPAHVGGYAVVWAVLDLGWNTYYSVPLILGQISRPRRDDVFHRIRHMVGKLVTTRPESGTDPPCSQKLPAQEHYREEETP